MVFYGRLRQSGEIAPSLSPCVGQMTLSETAAEAGEIRRPNILTVARATVKSRLRPAPSHSIAPYHKAMAKT